jgi:hypothetical protein
MGERESTPQEPTDNTVHGGEGDPLGGGVADLEDSEEVTEGIPQQDS